jgi:hypothetical protein
MKKIKELFVLALGLIIIVSFSNCKKDNTLPPLEGKTFIHSLVKSKEECDLLVANGTFNCAQFISLKENNFAEVIVTDIISPGTYKLDGNTLTITLDQMVSDPAAESEYNFIMNDDQTEMSRTVGSQKEVWKLEREGVDPWDL